MYEVRFQYKGETEVYSVEYDRREDAELVYRDKSRTGDYDMVNLILPDPYEE